MTAITVLARLRATCRLDRDGLDVSAGLRVGVSVGVPVALGLLSGSEANGTVAALGALNVAMAEGVGNYSSRALTLGSVLVGNAVSMGAGTLAAMTGWWSLAILFGWAVIAAYLGVIGPVAERTGWFAALMFMIGLGLPDPGAADAVRHAGCVAAGGAWAVTVIVVLWPLHPHRPVLSAVGRGLVAVSELLEMVGRSAPAPECDRVVARAEALGHEADAITRWRTARGGRDPAARHLRHLATLGERARSDAIVLVHRLGKTGSSSVVAAVPWATLQLGRALETVGSVYRRGHQPRHEPEIERAGRTAAEVARSLGGSGANMPALLDLCAVLAALSQGGEPPPEDAELTAGRRDDAQWLPAPGTRAMLLANLTMSSFWFRYAARFAIAAAAGLAIARALDLEHGYWVLITTAVVIKPQLSPSTTATVHRAGGTVLGALLGIVLVVTVPCAWGLAITLFPLAVIAVSLTRVNYGLAVVFITPLVLVLLSVAHPGRWEIADARVIDTLIGAAIGLLATHAIPPGNEPPGG